MNGIAVIVSAGVDVAAKPLGAQQSPANAGNLAL